jgi:hypothetical protein
MPMGGAAVFEQCPGKAFRRKGPGVKGFCAGRAPGRQPVNLFRPGGDVATVLQAARLADSIPDPHAHHETGALKSGSI